MEGSFNEDRDISFEDISTSQCSFAKNSIGEKSIAGKSIGERSFAGKSIAEERSIINNHSDAHQRDDNKSLIIDRFENIEKDGPPPSPSPFRQGLTEDGRTRRIIPKLVYVVSVMSLIFLTYCVFDSPWMLPYYYTATTIFLIWLRIIMYWRMNYLFFMLDFCYFATVLNMIFLWLMPQNELLFSVVYGISNGPVLWAVIVYRNSLVFHSIDKITSAFIHIMPAIITFSLRWRAGETSRYWYREIAPRQESTNIGSLVAIPLAFFVMHMIMYVFLVYVVLQPSSEQTTSYRHLVNKEASPLFQILNAYGEKYRLAFFVIFNCLFCFVSLLLSMLLYTIATVNLVIVALAICISVYNGGSYYIDVFSTRYIHE